jgi:hypothetical protein
MDGTWVTHGWKMEEAERSKQKKTAPHGAASRKKFLNLRELVNLGFPDVWILKCTVLR